MLRFSANLCSLFTERPLAERFRAACAAGFQGVELQCSFELGVAPLGQLLQNNGLRLMLISLPAAEGPLGCEGIAGIPGREAAFRAAVQAAARYVEALGIPAINVRAGRKPQGVLREACDTTLIQNLEYATSIFRDVGATTLLEAVNGIDHPRSLVSSADDMRRLCEAVPRLKMLFNCYHMHRMSPKLLEDLEACLPHVGHVQFADNPGRQEPGTGRIDYEAVFSLLRESTYQGWCGADYQPSRATEETLGWRQPPQQQLPRPKSKGFLRAMF